MPSINHRTGKSIARVKRNDGEVSPFDGLARECDAWFDKEGSPIFIIEVQASKSLLASLPMEVTCQQSQSSLRLALNTAS
jgi:hypothetical protein